MWRWKGLSPSSVDERVVCHLALDISVQYEFGDDTINHLRAELERVRKELGTPPKYSWTRWASTRRGK